ncbi:hypothetical protein ABW22_13025 [Thiobacillus denitrificans]|uniref:Uncharacterized protein n=1 Tax=Thiobacillus denitrificans TaxID=36861 RepID=A0A119CUW6_THIDE|nr:hypothetical protein ABW22_13025 [Thiobacillus denitrificans]
MALLSGAELDELTAMFAEHGADEFDDLPVDAQARVLELLDVASHRDQPAPLARMEPGYDVMAETLRLYA